MEPSLTAAATKPSTAANSSRRPGEGYLDNEAWLVKRHDG